MSTRILIADDDLEIIELLKFTFETENYEVVTAIDGEEAVKRSLESKFDMIILDVMMPRLNGFEACEKIRSNPNTCMIPIVMLTSLNQTKDRITGLKLGADEYLNKPIEPYELVTRVERLLERTRQALVSNPLTGLPGNIAAETEIKQRLIKNENFVVIYADINQFNSYNDKFGFERGDDILRLTATIFASALRDHGNQTDFLAHLDSDNFMIITTSDKIDILCATITKNFDSMVTSQFPVTVALGAAYSKGITHYAQLIEKAKKFWKLAKQQPKNTYQKEERIN